MKIKTLRRFGLMGGFLLVFLAGSQFVKTYQQGNANWMYFIMACGMSIILYSTIFGKSKG